MEVKVYEKEVKKYEKDGVKFEYTDDMDNSIAITDKSGCKVMIPADVFIAFIAHNITSDDCSIFHAIVKDRSIPIDKINMNFEFVKKIW